MNFDFYKGKKIFLTGHTGFKGAWLNLWLNMLGANVFGYSLAADTQPSLHKILNLNNGIYADILDEKTLEKEMLNFQPDIVFHLAAQPLVRKSYEEPVLTYKTNIIGTLNVLEAAKKCKNVKAFVNVTTDKCYENKEQEVLYKEDDILGGYDMYSSSKACSEILSSSYRRSFLKNSGFSLATARAGNVIGGGDWAQDRLIPDCIKAINQNEKIVLRNPNSIRPWQHVLEPLSGYMILAEKLFNEGEKYAQSFNFGPNKENAICVKELVENVCSVYGKGEFTIDKSTQPHEANLLMLDASKAKNVLNWTPKYDIETAILKTVEWYKIFYEGKDAKNYTEKQIAGYMKEI